MITKTGKYKKYPIVGSLMMSFGIFLMSTAKVDTPYWQIAIYALIIGGGLGLCMQTIVIALQNAVEFKDLGIATSSNTFSAPWVEHLVQQYLGQFLVHK